MHSRIKAQVLGGIVLVLGSAAGISLKAQERPYFVDGFHGGVYGHYPMTYTKFLCDQFDANPEWSFCLEIEPETWDTVKVKTPVDYARFCEVVKSPRVEFTNPAYAQPYCYNISGESIIRQFQYGMEKINAHFPDVKFETYSVEEPCFTSCLPQLLTQLGFKYACLKCPDTCWGGYSAAFGLGPVNWIGPDGSSILTVPRYACEDLQDGTVWQTTAWGNTDEYLEACRKAGVLHPVGMCFQDAGWTYGPWIGYGDKTRNNSIYVTWKQYLEQIACTDPVEDYPMLQEDVKPGLVWGAQILQRLSAQVRHSENLLVQTEKACGIMKALAGSRFSQEQIDEAWRTLMLAQHHDSWIVPYNKLNKRGTWADNIELWTAASDSLCLDQLSSLLESTDCGDCMDVAVLNTVGFSRKSWASVSLPLSLQGSGLKVTDSKGRKLPAFVEDGKLHFRIGVPSFGAAGVRIEKSASSSLISARVKEYDARSGKVKVSSDLYRLTFDPWAGGGITSIVAADGTEYVDQNSERRMNELRGWFTEEDRWHSSTDNEARVTVTEYRGLMTKVRVDGSIAGVPFVQTIVLKNGEKKIEMSLDIDWERNCAIGAPTPEERPYDFASFYDDRYKLSLSFPFAFDEAGIVKDAPFDVCRSTQPDTWFDRWSGIKHNVVLDWLDVEDGQGRGAALFTDHTTSYCHGPGYPLSLTVQYSGGALWGRNYVIDRPTSIRYALYPHKGDWTAARVQAEKESWHEPLLVLGGSLRSGASLVNLENPGYEISAFIPTGDGYLLRIYNASSDERPSAVRLSLPLAAVDEVDLNGNVTGKPEFVDGRMTVSIPRFGIRTYSLKTK